MPSRNFRAVCRSIARVHSGYIATTRDTERSHHLVRSQHCSRRQAHFFFNSEAQFKTTFTCVAFVSASGSFMQTIFCPLLITP